MRRELSLVLLLVFAGCSSDVRLGAVGADSGSPDASAGPDAAFASTSNGILGLSSGVSVECEGSLGGREGDFAGWTPSTAGISEGPVQLTWVTESSLQVSGSPIVTAFEVQNIGLLPNVVPGQPEELLMGIVSVSGAGPTGMSKDAGLMMVDRSTITSQSIEGQAGIVYVDTSNEGICRLMVEILIELQA